MTTQENQTHRSSAESLRDENESLRQAVEKGDLATFSLWLQKIEHETKDNAIEHAFALVRAAGILNAANRSESAVELLLRAAKLTTGGDPKTAEMIATLLRQYGGTKALERLSTESAQSETTIDLRAQLDDVQHQLQEAMNELNALWSHDWKEQSGYLYTDEERDARLLELKGTVQDLSNKRAKLRHQLGLDKPKK